MTPETTYLVIAAALTVVVLLYIRWQKARDRKRWPGMWR